MGSKLFKEFKMRKIFNFSKELKKIQRKPIKLKTDMGKSTFIGINTRKKPIHLPDNAKHIFVCGTTGSGKTVALANFIKSGIDKDYPMVIIDGKGDIGENSILDITQKLGKHKKIYIIDLNNSEKSDKYNPFKNANPTIVKDMLINMTNWSEEHYKLNTERYIQRIANLVHRTNAKLCFQNIIKCIPTDNFIKLSNHLLKKELITREEHVSNIELSKTSGKISEGAAARFSTIAESEIGNIFHEDGIDIYTALQEKAIILFILNPLIYPEISPLIGRLLLIDSKKAVSNLFGKQHERIFFIFDEINVYASPTLLDLVNKSRSANVTCILATQSLSDLDSANGEFFKEQIIENCNNYIVLRQNSSINAEHWANIIGTRSTLELTYQLEQNMGKTAQTGFGSAKRVREYLFHPDEIKTLKIGNGIYLSKDNNFNSRVLINKPF